MTMAMGQGHAPSAPDDAKVDWFSGRRDYFIRQAINDILDLIVWFQRIYALYRDRCLSGPAEENDAYDATWRAARVELLHQVTCMVGTEDGNGRLWRLKDLCHRIWPQSSLEHAMHGMLLDWTVGSLFHECLKLKETLYLLENYGARTVAVDTLTNRIGVQEAGADDAIRNVRALIGQIMEDVGRQMERVGFLFSQVNFLVRAMLPTLMVNGLVVRLLVEKEDVLCELWGETLEEIFDGLFGGDVAVGFCQAGWSFFEGQWYQEARQLYQRALRNNPNCHEALVKGAHLNALLMERLGDGRTGNQTHNP